MLHGLKSLKGFQHSRHGELEAALPTSASFSGKTLALFMSQFVSSKALWGNGEGEMPEEKKERKISPPQFLHHSLIAPFTFHASWLNKLMKENET